MNKKSKFNKINEWIKAEYDRETKEIEDSLSNDGSFDPDQVDSDKLFQRIQAQIKERENGGGESQPQKEKRKINGYQVRKWAALFFITVTGIFLASMTSRAKRSYLMYTIQYLVGNEMTLEKGNEKKDNYTINQEKEQKIKQEIENEIDISVPSFEYNLKLSTDDTYNIQYGNAIATLEYQYDDNILNLRMYNKNKADITGIDFQGRIITKLNIKKKAFIILVKEIKNPEDEETTLTAQWEYQNGYYQLSGKVPKKEFIEILKSISY